MAGAGAGAGTPSAGRRGGAPRPDPARDSVLERGLQVLQSFRPTGEPQTLTEIARRTDLPKSTASRVVATLSESGFLERRTDGWVLGRAVFELGALVPIRTTLREAALPFMEELYEATHETIHLGVRDDLDVLYVERIRGHSGIDVPSRVGGKLPLTCTGVGKTLLAFSPESVAREVLARPLRTLTPTSITDRDVLVRELAAIRAAGVGYDREEAAPGVSCVAAPVLVGGVAVACVSVAVPTERMAAARLDPAVRLAALGISRALAR